jgi:hypothetical protein
MHAFKPEAQGGMSQHRPIVQINRRYTYIIIYHTLWHTFLFLGLRLVSFFHPFSFLRVVSTSFYCKKMLHHHLLSSTSAKRQNLQVRVLVCPHFNFELQ